MHNFVADMPKIIYVRNIIQFGLRTYQIREGNLTMRIVGEISTPERGPCFVWFSSQQDEYYIAPKDAWIGERGMPAGARLAPSGVIQNLRTRPSAAA
jgi:hypothetical protein